MCLSQYTQYEVEPQVVEGSPVTRGNQLAMRAGKRKMKNKKVKNPKKKMGASKGNNKGRAARRRAVLRRAGSRSFSSKASGDDGVGKSDEELDDDLAPVKMLNKRKVATATPDLSANVEVAAPESKRGRGRLAHREACEKRSKPKAKAKAKAATAPKAKANPKAKAKGKAKAAAKAKALPKGKAKAKAKSRGRKSTKGKKAEAFLAEVPDSLDGWMNLDGKYLMVEFAAEMYNHRDLPTPEFKNAAWETLPSSDHYKSGVLNVYWTRHACGLTLKAIKKDLTSFSFTNKVIPSNLRTCVAIRAASLLVPWPGNVKWNLYIGPQSE